MSETPSLLLDLTPDHRPPLVAVRRWAAQTLPRAAPRFVSDAQLVATELVTNAYDHAGGALGIRLAYEPGRGRLLVEVDDASDEPPERRESGVTDLRGRGLMLVGRLAEVWGSRARPGGGKTVWAVLTGDGAGRTP
ncbi:ATP-binding protein [Amycolatopsis alkalitolerans]|uniref:ATP-binding protein n=2 Tax=Amycolatopsis alkalitolerans TaxID=2547244 RepID=A0A5C4M2C2_9PSEU|nr:ATP-binding protein [Amycolatopsis alkalitolerans]